MIKQQQVEEEEGSVTRYDLGNFLKPLATINLPKSQTFFCNFCKVVKSIIFLAKNFLGNFYRHLAIIFWSHWRRFFQSIFCRNLCGRDVFGVNENSVTRFGKILKYLATLLRFHQWQTFEYRLKIQCAFVTIYVVVNGEILSKHSSHLVTLNKKKLLFSR